MFALSLLDLVAYLIKDGLLSLPTNIKIDRSININLFCFVTKMAQLNLVYHVSLIVIRPCGVSNKRWAPKLTCQHQNRPFYKQKTFCRVTENLGLLSILKSILNFKTLFNLILYNVECVIVHTPAKWSNIIWEGKYLI